LDDNHRTASHSSEIQGIAGCSGDGDARNVGGLGHERFCQQQMVVNHNARRNHHQPSTRESMHTFEHDATHAKGGRGEECTQPPHRGGKGKQ